MTISDFYNEVSRLTDTDKTQIGVADTKRVLAVAFQLLATYDAATAADVFAKGLAVAAKKAVKPAPAAEAPASAPAPKKAAKAT